MSDKAVIHPFLELNTYVDPLLFVRIDKRTDPQTVRKITEYDYLYLTQIEGYKSSHFRKIVSDTINYNNFFIKGLCDNILWILSKIKLFKNHRMHVISIKIYDKVNKEDIKTFIGKVFMCISNINAMAIQLVISDTETENLCSEYLKDNIVEHPLIKNHPFPFNDRAEILWTPFRFYFNLDHFPNMK